MVTKRYIYCVLFTFPLDVDSEEQREFDEAFSEVVRGGFSDIVAPADTIKRVLERIGSESQ